MALDTLRQETHKHREVDEWLDSQLLPPLLEHSQSLASLAELITRKEGALARPDRASPRERALLLLADGRALVQHLLGAVATVQHGVPLFWLKKEVY